MFESLGERLEGVFKKFRGQKRLTEDNVQEGLREVRLALLEADVNFKVVKDFVERIREKALGQDVLKGLDPGQQVVKVVHDELVELLGGATQQLDTAGPKPLTIMMVGLQGSGKTTSAGKLALYLRREKKLKPYLVPADVYRPAAIDQLKTLGRQLEVPVYPSTPDMNPVDICRNALEAAKAEGRDLVLFDTAGRLHIDEALMDELANIKAAVHPREILFVADAMTGQDAVTVAHSFDEKLGVTGVVLTKMDGDARGGAALSIKSVTGKQVKFVGMGEKLSELEVFHPERIASRILGMGDVMTLIEKAQKEFDEGEAEALGQKFKDASFNFEDFRAQMRRLRKLGSIEGLLKLIPGMGGLTKQLSTMAPPEKEMKRVEAIIDSMTRKERRQPALLNPSRKERIAKGSGASVAEVNQLVKNFEQMRQMMSSLMGGKPMQMPKMPKLGGGRRGMPPVQMPGMPGGGRPAMPMPGMGPGAGAGLGNMPQGGLPGGMPGGMPGSPWGQGPAGVPGMPGQGREAPPKSSFTKKKKDHRKKKKR